jgi:hypothetical protein
VVVNRDVRPSIVVVLVMIALFAVIAWAVMRSKQTADEMMPTHGVAPVGEQV